MDKSKAIFLVGNYGVGKSTIIKEPVLKNDGIFLMIRDNLYVLGTNIRGADSLYSHNKAKVIEEVIQNKTKNIIITGNYYCQIKDIKELSVHFNVILVYLKTSFENNEKRILKRGKLINIDTYNSKLKGHISLINNTKGYRKLYIVDNNRDIESVKNEFYKIIKEI
jgi:shikimate kinase